MGGEHINNWAEKLEYSMGERESFDISLLQSIIPGCVSVEKTPPEVDKTGIDYIATLRRGAKINIDVKSRNEQAAEFWKGEAELALEIWSVCPSAGNSGKVGWTLSESTGCDYILYKFAPGTWDKFYLLPFQLLRTAFIRNYKLWKSRYRVKRQKSEGGSNRWESEAIFVPASIVVNAVSEEMTVQ